MMLGGAGCALIGLWWILDGFSNGPMNQLLGGLWWKGPLLAVGGVAAFVIGIRVLHSVHGADTESAHEEKARTNVKLSLELPQLVGLNCARCRRTVGSVAEAIFCPECGNPVHATCYKPDGPLTGDGRCPACAGDVNSAIAAVVRKARLQAGGRQG
jgi:hypothetical protein